MRDVTVTLLAVLVAFGAGAPVAAGSAPTVDSEDLRQPNGATAGASAVDQSQCTYPVEMEDATGTAVTVGAEPDRIVTLAPSAAQTLWEFNASEKVVGLSEYALYLEGADENEVVLEGFEYDIETIIALEPDLVLAPNVTAAETVETLRTNGVTVFQLPAAANFEDVYAKSAVIGELSGECEAASDTVNDMRQRVDAIREAVRDEERPGTVYVLGTFTAGDDTFIDDILETAGTRNVAADADIDGYRELNEEIIANRSDDIEWLVLEDPPGEPPGDTVWTETTAIQDDQTVALNTNYLNQPAPRTVLVLETLTRAVHPEAYEEAQAILAATPTPTPTTTTPTASTDTTTPPTTTAAATTTMADTATPPTTETDTQTPTPADTAAGGSGFGLVAGVLALLAVGLLGRRQ